MIKALFLIHVIILASIIYNFSKYVGKSDVNNLVKSLFAIIVGYIYSLIILIKGLNEIIETLRTMTDIYRNVPQSDFTEGYEQYIFEFSLFPIIYLLIFFTLIVVYFKRVKK